MNQLIKDALYKLKYARLEAVSMRIFHLQPRWRKNEVADADYKELMTIERELEQLIERLISVWIRIEGE